MIEGNEIVRDELHRVRVRSDELLASTVLFLDDVCDLGRDPRLDEGV